ncbi:MAG: hypothetical protein WC272_08220 [Sulfurimonas sp.]|jgi:hypothetical protein
MITINSSDFIKKPSYITQPLDITFVEDAKKHITKSVVIPYSLYEKLREKIEDELYLIQNSKALGKDSYKEFLEIEEVVEDL